jgi:acetoacetyl-CoA synthetase
VTLDEGLTQRISERLRAHASPRHVPARIVQVADLPRTRSGKLVELAVHHVVHGQQVTNREALANPESLEYFRDLAGLQS